MLFSLAIHNILINLQSTFNDTVVLAYLDDVFLVGPSLSVVDAFRHLKEQFGKVGLQIQDQKCEMYSPLPSAVPSTSVIGDIRVTSIGTQILGIPIGHQEYVSKVCLEVVKSGNNLCQQLPDLNEPQGAMIVLRHCHTTRLNHLSQGVCPTTLQSCATLHDQMTKQCFMALAGVAELTPNQ